MALPERLSRLSLDVCRTFYKLPISTRLEAAAFRSFGVLGYYPSEMEVETMNTSDNSEIPLFSGVKARGYSSFDYIANPNVLNTNPLFSGNRWPESRQSFRDVAENLYQEVSRVMLDISLAVHVKMKGSGLASGSLWDGCLDDRCCCLLRLLKYAKCGAVKMSKPHTDYEFLTMVHSGMPGLEVLGRDMKWTQPVCTKDECIILPGDMCEVMSGGRIRSTSHRVRFGMEDRLAVIFFQGFRLDQPLEGESARMIPTFGHHLCSMLVRGAPHLQPQISDWEQRLGWPLPSVNPFRK